ncbi:MAG: hypothetical protein IPK60_03105 [Sandaracinaceae bacterium]|nr:hypothetical protein [Sandaracinaceae bacterium]
MALVASAAIARADRRPSAPPPAPPISVRLSPWQQPDPPVGDARYFYVLEVSADSDPNADVVLDRRLLHFEFRDEARRRNVRCDHPAAPRAQVAMRHSAHLTDNGANVSYREWIDLRSYCFGRSLDALNRGAHVRVSYGFTRGGRTVWVAKSGENKVRSVDAGELDFAAVTAPASADAAIVRLAPIDRASASGMSFNVSVASRTGRRRVYVRPDLFQFRIRGPLGVVSCGVPRQPIVPIADFFSRVTERSAAHRILDAQQFCPDAFLVEGVYEVTPIAELPYTPRGAASPTDVITGRFEGAPALVRIRSGARGYVDQDPNDGRPRVTHDAGSSVHD